MTSTTEYYPGRRVYHIDTKHELHSVDRKVYVIRICKKGILCAVDDGTQQIFRQSEIEVYPHEK